MIKFSLPKFSKKTFGPTREKHNLDEKFILKNIVVWGTGAHYTSLKSIIEQNNFNIAAYIDKNFNRTNLDFDIPIFSGVEDFLEFVDANNIRNLYSVVAISNKFKKIRVSNYELLLEHNVIPLSIFDKSSIIRDDTSLGVGIQVMSNAFINSGVKINNYCIINSGAIIEHDCILEEGVEVGPGAILTGKVHIKKFTQIGAGAVLLPGIVIEENCVVGAGSVVTKNLPENAIVIGNPATSLF
jgi:sugar O-acyltransferase (sialic acid O-acetyltransferase NeuD family)